MNPGCRKDAQGIPGPQVLLSSGLSRIHGWRYSGSPLFFRKYLVKPEWRYGARKVNRMIRAEIRYMTSQSLNGPLALPQIVETRRKQANRDRTIRVLSTVLLSILPFGATDIDPPIRTMRRITSAIKERSPHLHTA